jgi:two-component system LytT family sensor kinase
VFVRKLMSGQRWRSVLLFIGGWTIIGLVFAAVTYIHMIGANEQYAFSRAVRSNLLFFYLWAVFSLFLFRVSCRFPVELRSLRFGRLLLYLLGILLVASLHQSVHLALGWVITPGFREGVSSIGGLYRKYFAFGLYLDLIIAALIAIAAHAFVYYRRFRVGEVQQSELKAQLAQAQLQAFKMQLHPHFLFNTLHSISSLVLDDPPAANAMIARLGDFLRLTLDHSDEQMVTLTEEIQFLRCYLEIEQVRLADRLTVEFNIDPKTLSAYVPNLILQPVVENAIQHAIAPRAAPGRISVEATRLAGLVHLEVKDNGDAIGVVPSPDQSRGRGLSNVRARLQQIYGSEFSFEMARVLTGGLAVTIEIPFRHEMSNGLASQE